MDSITARYFRADQIRMASAIIDIAHIIQYASGASTIVFAGMAWYCFGQFWLFLAFAMVSLASISLAGWAWFALPSDLDELLTSARDIEIAQQQEHWRIP